LRQEIEWSKEPKKGKDIVEQGLWGDRKKEEETHDVWERLRLPFVK
jgi:hypothetical protein